MDRTNRTEVKGLRTESGTLLASILTPEVGFSPEDCASASKLTKRQLELLRLLAQGKSGRAVAWDMGKLAVKTVESHIEHIKKALGLETAAQVRVWAVKYFLAVGGAR